MGHTDESRCVALLAWLQLAVVFALPTALLLRQECARYRAWRRRASAAERAEAERQRWPALQVMRWLCGQCEAWSTVPYMAHIAGLMAAAAAFEACSAAAAAWVGGGSGSGEGGA